jgi:transposase InsO family protein
VTAVYAAVEAIAAASAFATAAVCDTLDVSRSAYYAWRDGEPAAREREADELRPLIVAIFWQHRRRYGARRIAAELADRGIACSPRRVAKALQTQGLRAIQPRSFVPKTTDSRHHLGYSPNLILDTPDPTAVDQLWVGDITYLPLRRGGFVYLAALMDRFSRDIVGWNVASHLKEPLVLAALRQAIRARQPQPGLVHHTDRGGQYAGRAYRATLGRAGLRQSMSRADNCYDNAFMESCFGTFKTEMENAEYDSEAAARAAIARYVSYYRFDRKHSSLGYLAPAQFARLTAPELVS